MEIKRKLIIVFFLFFGCPIYSTEAYDPLDPNAHIEIIWDIIRWIGNGYEATVRIENNQQYRHIELPGWRLGWKWLKHEVIWSMQGAETTELGDCSKFKGLNIPHSCKKNPTIVDLMPGTPYNQQIANCCTGGVLSSSVQNPAKSQAMFQMQVGFAGNNKSSVKPPEKFKLGAPGSGYTCSRAFNTHPTSKFWSPDHRRSTQAFVTWRVKCNYTQRYSDNPQTCCVSLSSFYSPRIAFCPTCTCGCRDDPSHSGRCTTSDSSESSWALSTSPASSSHTLVECSSHMCPIRVNWHIKTSYKLYWLVKVTITNLNYRANYSHWNLVIKHPNLENLTQVSGLHYHPLINYGNINDTGMLWGSETYNDLLMTSGPNGNIQTELLFKKVKSKFTFDNKWAFPRRIYFNGDQCVTPPIDEYPLLPN